MCFVCSSLPGKCPHLWNSTLSVCNACFLFSKTSSWLFSFQNSEAPPDPQKKLYKCCLILGLTSKMTLTDSVKVCRCENISAFCSQGMTGECVCVWELWTRRGFTAWWKPCQFVWTCCKKMTTQRTSCSFYSWIMSWSFKHTCVGQNWCPCCCCVYWLLL